MRVYLVSLDGFRSSRTFYLGQYDTPQDAIRLFFRRRGVAVSSVSRPSIVGSYADGFEAYVEYAATASVWLYHANENAQRLVDVPVRVRKVKMRQNAPESTNAAQHEPTQLEPLQRLTAARFGALLAICWRSANAAGGISRSTVRFPL